MKKLSTLSADTIVIYQIKNGDVETCTADCLIEFVEGHAGAKAFVGESVFAKANIFSFLEYIGEGEMYQDWVDDVMEDIKASDFRYGGFFKEINAIFKRHPTYYKGEEIEIDAQNEKWAKGFLK
ncbi:MAG: hypothetical protein RR053_07110 [Evtepia sp.]